METIGQGRDAEDKLVIYFAGKQKQFICNKTNANAISKLHGDDTDMWLGKVINIAPREVEFQGDTVWAIRVCTPAPGTTPARTAAAPRSPAPHNTTVAAPVAPPAPPADGAEPPHDDDVPF